MDPEIEPRVLFRDPIAVLGPQKPVADPVVGANGPGVVVGRQADRRVFAQGHLGPEVRGRRHPVKHVGLYGNLLSRSPQPAAPGQQQRQNDLLHQYLNLIPFIEPGIGWKSSAHPPPLPIFGAKLEIKRRNNSIIYDTTHQKEGRSRDRGTACQPVHSRNPARPAVRGYRTKQNEGHLTAPFPIKN